MSKKLSISLALFLIFSFCYGHEDSIRKETHIFAIKGLDTLKLDKYDVPNDKHKPCLIFVFGGGFYTGTRDNKKYISHFEEFAKRGYVVVSIDYRLGLKDLDTSTFTSPLDIVPKLKGTIDDCVEDLFDATSFVVKHSSEWNIDPSLIITSGSSAGAITVLQSEYELCNQSDLISHLPSEFSYAGVISYAGAILSMDGKLEWKNRPAPIQLFHGDCDGNVPYDKIELMSIGFYGSKHISDQFIDSKIPHYFVDFVNHKHEVAENPMTENINDICSFIDNLVIKKKNLILYQKVISLDKKDARKPQSVLDYIVNNFGS